MKKLLTILGLTCALALGAQAGDGKGKDANKRQRPTAEQKAARKALIEKYDTDKSGRLSKEELAKATPEEREKAGYAERKHAGKKSEKKPDKN